MAITALDKSTALVVIDLQKGITKYPTVHSMSEVIRKSASLADVFRRASLPVVLVNVLGVFGWFVEQQPRISELPPEWTELVPELKQRSGDILVSKRTWGAFTRTGLEHELDMRGVTQVVICGVATSIGVESTARQAFELGFNVTLAIDAMTDMSLEAHENSISRIFPRLGESATTNEILEFLAAEVAV